MALEAVLRVSFLWLFHVPCGIARGAKMMDARDAFRRSKKNGAILVICEIIAFFMLNIRQHESARARAKFCWIESTN